MSWENIPGTNWVIGTPHYRKDMYEKERNKAYTLLGKAVHAYIELLKDSSMLDKRYYNKYYPNNGWVEIYNNAVGEYIQYFNTHFIVYEDAGNTFFLREKSFEVIEGVVYDTLLNGDFLFTSFHHFDILLDILKQLGIQYEYKHNHLAKEKVWNVLVPYTINEQEFEKLLKICEVFEIPQRGKTSENK